MKHVLAVILWLSMAAIAMAADVKLAWDPADPTEQWSAVRIYEVVGTNYTKVGEVTGDKTEITLTAVSPGRHVYIARSVNQWGESANSNQAITPNLGNPPKNLRWSIVITVP